jgi:5'-nucleotidase
MPQGKPPFFYKNLFVRGVPVGFIGVPLEEVPTIRTASRIKDPKFLDEADAIDRYVPELEE